MTHSYLLDTSALVAHFLGQPGGDFVADCLRKGQAAVCALTVVEFQALLKRQGLPQARRQQVWSLFREVIVSVFPVDEDVAALAVQLRDEAATRIPLADACIAACAVRHQLILLHSDSHYGALPTDCQATDLRRL
jgi:predicted nucleic acid-binding protein